MSFRKPSTTAVPSSGKAGSSGGMETGDLDACDTFAAPGA
jgi:hypothetical protein